MKSFGSKSRISVEKMFLIVLIAVSLTAVLAIYVQTVREERVRYEAQAETDASKVFLYFSSDFSHMQSGGNTIFSSLWYQHLRNPAGIYKDEFQIIRRNEISQLLHSTVLSMKLVANILVITPDHVITKEGWFRHEQYESYYHDVQIAEQDGQIRVTAANDAVFPFLIRDPYTTLNQGAVCLLVDRNEFSETIGQLLPEETVFCSVTLQGQPLFEMGEKRGSIRTSVQSMRSPDARLEICVPGYLSGHWQKNLLLLVLCFFADLLACFAISKFFSHIVAKPLLKLIRQIGGNTLDDPYSQLDAFIAESSERNEQLSQQKNRLSRSIQKIVSYTQKEIFLNMLTNRNFDFQEELLNLYIPWINEGYFFFFVLTERSEENIGSLLKKERLKAREILYFPLLQEQCCLFLWFEEIDAARNAQKELDRELEQMHGGSFCYVCSDILFEPETIYDNYCTIQKEFERLRESPHELPLMLQMKLVQYFYNGNTGKFLELARKNWNLYEVPAFFLFLSRLVREVSGTLSECAPAPDDSWECFAERVEKLQQENCAAQENNRNISGQLICEYIREHFCEEDMCVKKLADIFSIHRTLISKMVKGYTRKSFSDYLLDLRVQQAIVLMETTGLSVTLIGEKIGYANYITFKRAFLRAKGVTPREYRERLPSSVSQSPLSSEKFCRQNFPGELLTLSAGMPNPSPAVPDDFSEKLDGNRTVW